MEKRNDIEINKIVVALKQLQSCNQKDTTFRSIATAFTKTINANTFYLKTICNNNPSNYYERYFKTNERIEPHSIVYVDLTIGYPKELRYGHWCYVYKVLNGKALILPLTSIKDYRRNLKVQELEIVVCNNGMLTPSIMRIDEMRWIDIQRIDLKHAVPEKIQTPELVIKEKIKKFLNL